MKKPTEKQGKVLEAFRKIEVKQGWPATCADVAKVTGLKGSTIRYVAVTLMAKGAMWQEKRYPYCFTTKEPHGG